MKRTFVLALGLMAFSGTALAHHSFAMFNSDKRLLLEGSIKEMQWTNPHAWMQVMVPSPNGKVVEWSIEMNSPNMMFRSGWRRDTLKPGDKVRVMANPLRDGRPGGALVYAVLPDGKKMGQYADASGNPILPNVTLAEHLGAPPR